MKERQPKKEPNQFNPDYTVPPGWPLEERLKVEGLSNSEFACKCNRPLKLIDDIIAGTAPIDAETALQFEKVLGVDALYWLDLEAYYRQGLAKGLTVPSPIRTPNADD